jgi:hypothetical protein
LTFQHGGFAEAGDQLDEFSTKLRKDTQLQAEFSGARVAMLQLVNAGQVRFKAKTAQNAKAKLAMARKKVVEEFRESAQEIVTPYKMYDKAVFEEAHPGAIEKQGLKTTWKTVDGARREVVLVRQLPQGEWDVAVRERTGVKLREEIDSSDLQIHEGQQLQKFEGSRKRLTVAHKANDAAVLEQLPGQGSRQDEVTQVASALAEQSSEEDDAPARPSLLDESPPRKSQRVGPSSSANSKVPLSAVSKPSAPAVSKAPAAKKGQPARESDAADNRGRPNKFKGRTTVEVLESNGLTEVKQSLAAANLPCTQNPPGTDLTH